MTSTCRRCRIQWMRFTGKEGRWLRSFLNRLSQPVGSLYPLKNTTKGCISEYTNFFIICIEITILSNDNSAFVFIFPCNFFIICIKITILSNDNSASAFIFPCNFCIICIKITILSDDNSAFVFIFPLPSYNYDVRIVFCE